MKLLIDAIGWVGALQVLLAYGLVSMGRIDAGSMRYQWLNLGGALGLVINTIYYAAYPSTAVNVVWGLIAIVAMRRLLGSGPGIRPA